MKLFIYYEITDESGKGKPLSEVQTLLNELDYVDDDDVMKPKIVEGWRRREMIVQTFTCCSPAMEAFPLYRIEE